LISDLIPVAVPVFLLVALTSSETAGGRFNCWPISWI